MMVLSVIYLLSAENTIENYFYFVVFFIMGPAILFLYYRSKQEEIEKEAMRKAEQREHRRLLRKEKLEAERKEKEKKEQEEKERLEKQKQVFWNRVKQMREDIASYKIKEEEERLAKEKVEQEKIKKEQEIRKQLEDKCRKKVLYILTDCSYKERREQIYKAVVTKIALERASEILFFSRCFYFLNRSKYKWRDFSYKESCQKNFDFHRYDIKTNTFEEIKQIREKSIQNDVALQVQNIESDVRDIMACKGQHKENVILELLISKEEALTRYYKLRSVTEHLIDLLQRHSVAYNKPIYPPLQEHIKTLKLDLPQDKIEDYLFQELVNLIKEQSEQEKIAKEQEHQRELEEQERKRKLEQERERQEKIRRENERIERERRERERLEQIEREKRQRELARQNEISYLRNSVSNWYTHRWNGSVKHKWYCDYYSYRDHKDSATSEMWDTWHFIWWFKNDPTATVPTTPTQYQQSLDKAVRLVENTLRETFGHGYLSKLTLVCCTASTLEKNERRFRSFAERVCNDLDIYNAYSHITITEDGNAKHEGGTGLTTKSYDSWWFKDKYIVLFDDVRTSGASLEREKAKLESFGATVICAITLGQTTN